MDVRDDPSLTKPGINWRVSRSWWGHNETKWSGKCQGDNIKDIRHLGQTGIWHHLSVGNNLEHFIYGVFWTNICCQRKFKSVKYFWRDDVHSIILISGVMISADEREFSANCFDKERVELIRSLKVSIRLFPNNVMGHLSSHPNYRRFWELSWVRTHWRWVAACH